MILYNVENSKDCRTGNSASGTLYRLNSRFIYIGGNNFKLYLMSTLGRSGQSKLICFTDNFLILNQ